MKSVTITTLETEVDGQKMTNIFATTGGPTPVGMLRLDLDEPAGWVASLFVSECVRGLGIGSQLLEKAFELCRLAAKQTVGLAVHNENEGARKLYTRLGFVQYLKSHDGYTQLVKVL